MYASSAAVFGVSEDDTPVSEDEADAPRTHYGWFKRTNEGNADIYFRDHGLSSVGLRPLTVYGVGRDTGITSDTTEAMRHAVLGLPFHIRFGGTTDFLYVADCAGGVHRLCRPRPRRRTRLQPARRDGPGRRLRAPGRGHAARRRHVG